MQEDDILRNLANEIARLEALARDSASRAEQLKAAETMIRTARGTGAGAEAPALGDLPTPATHAAEGATTYGAPTAAPRPTTPARPRRVSGDLPAQIEDALSRRSMRPLELASAIGTTPELTQSALDGLQRDGKVYRFHDGAYTWRVYNPSSDVLNALIKRYMTERQVSRAELRGAIHYDSDVGKYEGKHVDNHLYILRSIEPVWAQEDERGNMLYWLVPGQIPPKELDGRRPKRTRAQKAKKSVPVKSTRK